MIVKAIYENNVLRPLEELDLGEGEKVEIEVKKKGFFGHMKGWKVDSQALKDELKRD